MLSFVVVVRVVYIYLMWNVLNKEVDLGEPTSFLDHVFWGCTQRQCEISKDVVDNIRTMFESRISAGGVEKLPFPQYLSISSWQCSAERPAEGPKVVSGFRFQVSGFRVQGSGFRVWSLGFGFFDESGFG